MTARVPRPAACARRRRPLQDLAMDRRVADDAVVRPALAGLELRLDQRDDRGRRAGERRRDRPEDQRERDERDVDGGEVDRLGQASRRSGVRAFVRSIETTRGSRAERARRAGRDRRRERRPALAPRCSRTSVKPPVDAPTSRRDEPGRVDPERVERGRELVAAAADVRIGLRRPRSACPRRAGRPACGRRAPHRPPPP